MTTTRDTNQDTSGHVMPKTSWVLRRRTMFVVLAFCFLVVLIALFQDTEVAETAVIAAFGTIIAIVGSYVFAATWDDKNLLDASRR